MLLRMLSFSYKKFNGQWRSGPNMTRSRLLRAINEEVTGGEATRSHSTTNRYSRHDHRGIQRRRSDSQAKHVLALRTERAPPVQLPGDSGNT